MSMSVHERAGSALAPDGRFEVSVVIPSHDAYPMVVEAIESALSQTLPPREVVVVDDGSRDGTSEALAERYRERSEVRVVNGTFGSAGTARNAGWRSARAPWVAFLDADDVWFPDKLATAASALGACEPAGWFFSDGTFRPLDGAEWQSWLGAYAELPESYAGQPVAELLEVNFVLTSSVVVRRSLLEALGGFDERMSHAEDLDLWLRLARRAPAAASRRPLVRYQHRVGGLTRQTERRLMGDVELFRRLARDRDLSPTLRRRARRREALAHYKIAFAALREGRRRDLWARLGPAWMFPERTLPVLGLAAAGLLPGWALQGLGRRRWVTRGLARPALALKRVTLRSSPTLAPGRGQGDA